MFSKIKIAAAAVALTMVAAPAAFACYGNSCPGNNPTLPPAPSFPTSFNIQTMFSGNTQGMGEGYGDNVESQSFVNDLFTMNSFGNLTFDPNCAANCGDQTFGMDFSAEQQAGNFVRAMSTGHGNVSSGARSAIMGQFSAGGQLSVGSGM